MLSLHADPSLDSTIPWMVLKSVVWNHRDEFYRHPNPSGRFLGYQTLPYTPPPPYSFAVGGSWESHLSSEPQETLNFLWEVVATEGDIDTSRLF